MTVCFFGGNLNGEKVKPEAVAKRRSRKIETEKAKNQKVGIASVEKKSPRSLEKLRGAIFSINFSDRFS
jgi:hypothetical protein